MGKTIVATLGTRERKAAGEHSLEHEEQQAGADDQDHVDVEHRRVRGHHKPAVAAESVPAGEHLPFPSERSDFGHARWVIGTEFRASVMRRQTDGTAPSRRTGPG